MCDQQRLRPACAYVQSDQSICLSPEYSMSVKLLTQHHLEFLGFTWGGGRGAAKARLKLPHCWKSHVTAQIVFLFHFQNIMGPAHEISVLIADAQMPLISVHTDVFIKARFYHLGIVPRRPVSGVSDKERFKPVFSATCTEIS